MHSKRNWLIRAIVFVTFVVSLFLVVGILKCIDPTGNIKTYTVKFYERYNLVCEVTKNKGEPITSDELETVNQLISNVDNNYYLSWSYALNEYLEVDFETLNRNTSVYLHRFKNDFHVTFEDSLLYSYDIECDKAIKKGDDIKFKLEHLVDLNLYHPVVKVNGKELLSDDFENYVINSISEDCYINVEYLEKVDVRIVNKDYIFNKSKQYVEYELFNLVTNQKMTTEEVIVKYTNSENITESFMYNAGEYKVEISSKNENYYLQNNNFEIEVQKAKPEILTKELIYYYNGQEQMIDINDLEIDSTGKITFENNSFCEVGSYIIKGKLYEDNNYQEMNFEIFVEMKKAIPIITIKEEVEAFINMELGKVTLPKYESNVRGFVSWSNPQEVVLSDEVLYKLTFTPTDKDHYEIVDVEIKLNVIDQNEQLRRIKIEKERLQSYIDYIINHNLEKTFEIELTYPVDVTWISSSTIIKFASNGSVMILDVPNGVYDVIIFGIIQYGNAAEYVKASYQLVIENEEEEVTETLVMEEPQYVVEDVDYQFVSNYKVEIIAYQNDKDGDEILINDEMIKCYTYLAKCKMHDVISEIITWKVRSDSAPRSIEQILNQEIKAIKI